MVGILVFMRVKWQNVLSGWAPGIIYLFCKYLFFIYREFD